MNGKYVVVALVGGALIALALLRPRHFAVDAQAVAPPDSPQLGGRDVRLVDLTHAFDEKNIYWPTEIPFHLERGFAGITAGGWYYSANRFHTAEHSGTHVDAPLHFHQGAKPVDEIPLDRLIGPGCVVDVTQQCAADPDFLVSVAVFEAWENEHRQSLEEKIVLVRTGFAKFWNDRQRYLGTEQTGAEAVKLLHFPGVDPTAAQWLVDDRRIKAIGIDTASIDNGPSQTFATHQVLCAHATPAFENVADSSDLPPAGFTVIALPMKIRDGSGGPLRIVAAVPK